MNRQPRCYPDSTWVLFLSAAGQCSACCDNPFVRFDALIVPGALTWISVRELQASVCHLLPASSWLRVLANQCPALIFCPSCQYIIPIWNPAAPFVALFLRQGRKVSLAASR